VTGALFNFDTRNAAFSPLRDIIVPRFISDELGRQSAYYYGSSHLSKTSPDIETKEIFSYTATLLSTIGARLGQRQLKSDDALILGILAFIAVDIELFSDVRLS
jgi:hypothetical protein